MTNGTFIWSGQSSGNTATVSINVTNNAPIGTAQEFYLHAGGTLSVDATSGLRHGSYDPDNDTLTVEQVVILGRHIAEELRAGHRVPARGRRNISGLKRAFEAVDLEYSIQTPHHSNFKKSICVSIGNLRH
jgi:hypothetical protein